MPYISNNHLQNIQLTYFQASLIGIDFSTRMQEVVTQDEHNNGSIVIFEGHYHFLFVFDIIKH